MPDRFSSRSRLLTLLPCDRPGWRRSLLLCAVGLFSSAALAAGGPGDGHPLTVSFSQVTAPVSAVVQTPDRRVHVAIPSDPALHTYDGARWRRTELPCAPTALAASTSDRLWIGCLGQVGHSRLHGGDYTFLPLRAAEGAQFSDGLAPSKIVTLDDGALFVDRRSLILVHDEVPVLYRNESAEPFGDAIALGPSPVVARANELLVPGRTLSVLWRAPAGTITAIAPLQGRVLAAVERNEATDFWLVALDGAATEWGTLAEHHPYRAQALAPLGDGGVAVGTSRRGVVLLTSEGRLRDVLSHHGVDSGATVAALMVDHLGALWIGHERGLSRSSLSWPIRFLGHAEGLEVPVTWVRRHRGDLLVGTLAGVYRLERAQHPRPASFVPLEGVATATARSAEPWQAELWMATEDGLWRRKPDGRIQRELTHPFWAFSPLDEHHALGFRSSDRKLVVLERVDDGVTVVSEQSLPADIRRIRIESPTRAWLLSSEQRLFFTTVDSNGQLQSVRAVAADKTFTDVARVHGRLRFVSGGDIYVPGPAVPGTLVLDPWMDLDAAGPDGENDGALGLLESPGGQSWVYSKHGITRLADAREASRGYGVEATAAPYLDSEADGVVWIGHAAGVVRLELHGEWPTEESGIRPLLSLRAGDVDGSRRRLDFSVPHYFHETTITYQHRLLGLDDSWSSWATTPHEEYPHLPPGEYRFELRARQLGTDLGSTSLEFRIPPPWFLHPLVLIAALAGVVAAVMTAWRWRSARLRRRNRQLWMRVSDQTIHLRMEKQKVLAQARELEETNKLLERTLEINARQQRARRELELRFQQLERLDALGRLTAGVAHEFNNLLMGTLGNVQLLLSTTELEPEARECLEVAETNTLKAGDLCHQMLIVAGRAPTRPERVNPADLVESAKPLVEAAAGHRHRLEFDLPTELPPIRVDPARFRQVLVSLVVNSVEALGERPGRIAIRCGRRRLGRRELATLSFARELSEGDYDYVEVADDGPGMGQDVVKHVFDPFFSTKLLGRGLGLAAVLGVVEKHGGAVELHSEVDEGTHVRLYFPSVELPKSDDRPTILVVDDEPQVLDLAQRLLELAGYEALLALGGEKAIELFDRGSTASCVLLDIAMPDADGLEVLCRLRERQPLVPIVLSTGFAEEEIRPRIQGLKIDGFLPKPYSFAEMVAVLDDVLGKRSAPRTEGLDPPGSSGPTPSSEPAADLAADP